MEVTFLIGRILFAFLLLGSAAGHLTQTAAMAGYAQSKGLPLPRLAVVVSGVALILGAGSILLGIWGDLGSAGTAVLLAIMAFTMHDFWRSDDAEMKQNELIQFNKDLALAGGALAFYVVFYSHLADDLWTVTGPLFA